MARGFITASSESLYNASFAGFTGEPFSLGCWFRVDDNTVNNMLFSVAPGAGTAYHALYMNGANTRLAAYTYDGAAGDVAQIAPPVSNTWTHGLAVFAATNSRQIYKNGVAGTANTTNYTLGTLDTVKIGVSADTTPYAYLTGAVAEAAAWNVALTVGEALILATGRSPLMVRPESLVFYAPLWRDEDNDFVGGLALTTSGTPDVTTHPRVFYSFPSIILPLGLSISTTIGVEQVGSDNVVAVGA